MKRLLVLVLIGAAALLAVRRPAPAPAIAAAGAPLPAWQHTRKGHPLFGTSSAAIVYVAGAVEHPGLYRVPASARVNDAVLRAGGLRFDADAAAVNLAARISDGEEINVLRVGQAAPASHTRKIRRKREGNTAAAPVPLLDLNTADENALAGVPGLGATLAARIVEYRRLNGPFASVDELADVAGMTQRRVDAMSAYVMVGSAP
jgi:competence protein ComEA